MTTPDPTVIANSNIAALINRGGHVVLTSWSRIDAVQFLCSGVTRPPESVAYSIRFHEETSCASPSAIH